MSQPQKYDGPPSTFVNLKRVKQGEDSKGRETVTATFGLTTTKDGVEVNTLDNLIEALTALQGKQANITIHMEEKEAGGGRSFLSGFARVTEMVPKSAGGGATKTAYVPKAAGSGRADQVRARSQKIQQDFQD